MAPNQHPTQLVKIEGLLIDLENPRYDIFGSQREALLTIAREQGTKLANLAEDIATKGLNPSELLVVTETNQAGQYFVLEGNRRIAAIKLSISRDLPTSLGLTPALIKRYKTINEKYLVDLPQEVSCVVLDRVEATDWIRLKHTGENQGVGIVEWDGRAKQRFLGSSPALQAIELVEHSPYLTAQERQQIPKIFITNIHYRTVNG